MQHLMGGGDLYTAHVLKKSVMQSAGKILFHYYALGLLPVTFPKLMHIPVAPK
jgi:hypothetical protein